MSENDGDEQNGDDAVYHLRDLHPCDVRHVEWEQQQIARYRNCRTGAQNDPEHRLLSGVEPSGRRVLRADESAALLEPFDIQFLWDVVLDPEYRDQRNAEHESEAQEIGRAHV